MIDLGIDKPRGQTRVVVAMSGGVDSSTAAALVREAGYETVGVTLQLYDHGLAVQKKGACCAGQDIYDARRVAEAVGVPHYVLDYESRFRQAVMDDFADTYLRGETPIPCVRCNQSVKFRDLLDTAKDLGADALVTGHYVRRVAGARGPELHRASDTGKDQSYFLFATTAGQLDFLRFPLGEMTKAETRRHAERFALPVAEKAESQDICFVPDGDYAGVVERLRPGALDPGEIVDQAGHVLGRHDGIINFTVGQRRGLGVAAGEPLYVLRIEPGVNRVVVGPKEALGQSGLAVADVNWLATEAAVADSFACEVKIRSNAPAVAATVRPQVDGGAVVAFERPQQGVAPGQACVFYQGDRILGGGWIVREDARADAA